jgi:hypothetical protein
MGTTSHQVLSAALVLAATGCCTPIIHRAYSGPELDPSHLAVLLQKDGTYLMRVDGQPAPCREACCREIHLAPGPHDVGFSLFDADAWAKAPQTVHFVAEPGATYELHGADMRGLAAQVFRAVAFWFPQRWTGWVVDRRSGQVVGGRTPEMLAQEQ